MNLRHRIILCIGLFLLFISCIFVPWTTGDIETPRLMSVGYFPIWSNAFDVWTITKIGQSPPNIDSQRLIIQLFAIISLTSFGVIIAGLKKKL